MSDIKSYRDLTVWQRSMELAEAVYALTANFPREEQYRLTSPTYSSSNFHSGKYRRGKCTRQQEGLRALHQYRARINCRSLNFFNACITRQDCPSGIHYAGSNSFRGSRPNAECPASNLDLIPNPQSLIPCIAGGRTMTRKISTHRSSQGRLVAGAGSLLEFRRGGGEGASRSRLWTPLKLMRTRELAAQLNDAKPDAVFNALHGQWGEDGCVQGAPGNSGAALHPFRRHGLGARNG